MDKSHGFADGTGWGLQGNPDGTVSFFFGEGIPAIFAGVNTFATLRDDHWHHVAGVFTGAQFAIYEDSLLQRTLSLTNLPAANARDVEIGRSWGGGSPTRYYHGLIDELSYYNRALGADEITAIYNAGPAGKGPPPPLVLRAAAQGGSLAISFAARIGAPYAIESETSLAPNSWSVLTNVNAFDTNVTVTLPISGSLQRFYRVTTPGN